LLPSKGIWHSDSLLKDFFLKDFLECHSKVYGTVGSNIFVKSFLNL